MTTIEHPTRGDCERCGTPYRECAQGWTLSLGCCSGCDHHPDLRPDPNEHGPGPFRKAGTGPYAPRGEVQ